VKRVLTARFMYETNTFSRMPTDMAMIRRRDYPLENEIPAAFRGTRSAFGGTFEEADKFGWSHVHPVSGDTNPSSIVIDEARAAALSRGDPHKGDPLRDLGCIAEAADWLGRLLEITPELTIARYKALYEVTHAPELIDVHVEGLARPGYRRMSTTRRLAAILAANLG
jgi:hypothetical protein